MEPESPKKTWYIYYGDVAFDTILAVVVFGIIYAQFSR